MHQDIEARLTEPDEPGTQPGHTGRDWYVMDLLGLRRQRPWVDENTALQYLPFLACVRVIAQTLASVGWHVYDRMPGGVGSNRVHPIDDDVAWLLDMEASPELNAYEWRQVMLKDALACGNGFSEIERTPGGRPYWLHRLNPSRVMLLRDGAGNLLYRVEDPDGGEARYLPPRDVFHLRYLSPDGLVGYSPVALARAAIRVGLSIQTYKDTFFQRGPMPGGALEMPAKVSQKDLDNARQSFKRLYGGADNAGEVILLFGGMKFNPLSLPNDEAQLIESGTFSAEEMCRLFDVPQHKIGLLGKATNNNIEHQGIEFVQSCLLPWARRLECEANIKLFGPRRQSRRYTQLNLETLQRGDSAAQTESVARKVTSGLMTPNEGRAYLGLNPVEGGDVLLIQGAMVRLDDIVNRATMTQETQTTQQTTTESTETDNGSGSDPGGTDGDAVASRLARYLANGNGRHA